MPQKRKQARSKSFKGKSLRKSLNRRNISRKRTLNRRQKKRKSLSNTLNQMGGFIRDGSTQFFKIIRKSLKN